MQIPWENDTLTFILLLVTNCTLAKMLTMLCECLCGNIFVRTIPCVNILVCVTSLRNIT